MSSHGAAREWNSVVAAPPPISLKPSGVSSQRSSSVQQLPRPAAASTPAVPCRYTKAEMLAMYSPTDRPPSDFHSSLPVVSSECQAPVTSEPPSVSEREILESGTWYMPNARPNPTSSYAAKPGRNSAPRPARSAFSRTRSSAPDATSPASEYRPTRFNWRQDPHGPGSNDAEATEHRRGSVAEKSASRAAPIGRSDAALSWRRDDNEGSSSSVPAPAPPAERAESDAAPYAADPSAWRSPTIQSRLQSTAPTDPQPVRKAGRTTSDASSAVEGLADQIQHLEPVLCDSWWYQDPSGTIRGPFSADEMRDWYQQSYFQLTLPVRCHPDQPFTPLGALFLQGDPAFLDHVPVVMAAPVEPRRPPHIPAPQPYLPVHHHLQPHVLPQHLPLFQQQPQPPYLPHAFATAPSHSDTRLHSSLPFVSAPVLDQQSDSWAAVRQAPVPEVVRQAPWVPFFSSAPVPAPLHIVEHAAMLPEPVPVAITKPVSAPVELPQPIADQGSGIEDEAVAAPELEPVLQPKDRPAVSSSSPSSQPESLDQEDSAGAESLYEDDDAGDQIASVSFSAPSAEPALSSQSVGSSTTSSGWVSSPLTSAAPVKSLLEIQREEEEAHRKALEAQQVTQREAQASAQPEPHSSSGSAWGAIASKPATRSLLEIQKQEEIMQTTSKAAQKPASSGWAAKVAPMLSSWGPAPRPAAVSMRQIQEEEQFVLCQQQQPTQMQQRDSAPQRSGWSAAVAGSAWPRPDSFPASTQGSVARPAPLVSSSRPAVSVASHKAAQSESDSDDDAPFWNDGKKKSSCSDGSVQARNDFGGPILSPEFREWCQAQLAELSSDCDISLAEFLLTLESSDAIREYIYEYLGRSSKVDAFANGFLQLKEFDDSKLVVQSSRNHSSVSSKVANSDSQDLSKKKKNRRRRKKKSEYP